MPAPIRRRWVNTALVAALVILPIILYFILEQVAVYTRSGSVDAVWFADTPAGPRMIARDQIVAGTEREAKVRNRLVLVDASNGERIAREGVPTQLDLVSVGENALWFKHHLGKPELEARDWDTLELVDHPAGAAPHAVKRPPEDPIKGVVTLGSQELAVEGADAGAAKVLDPAHFKEAGFLADEATGEAIVLGSPQSVVVVHKPEDNMPDVLLVSRLGADLQPLWTAKLERQRSVRAAHVIGDTLIVVVSGAARDFAVALDVKDGRTKWVHHF